MKKIFLTTVALAVMAIFISTAQAITISKALVKKGVADVSGGKAASNANISWEGDNVTTANNNGGFSFDGVVPADCIGTLSDGVSTIDVALKNCTPTPTPEPTGGVLKTGQTTCYNTAGTVVTCAGTGQDGELQNGTARSYTPNADGTITDNSTGLVWEKLTNDATIHNFNDSYTWADAFAKIAALNTVPCFAGNCDWRVPNINELQTLADYGRVGLAIDPVFNNGVDSFTQADEYWSSTTYQEFPNFAWGVLFNGGGVGNAPKADFNFSVRAVRGGS